MAKTLVFETTLPDRRGWERYGSLRDVPQEPDIVIAGALVVVAFVHEAIFVEVH